MPVSHLVMAQLSAQIYQSLDGFDKSWTKDDVVIATKRIGDTDVLVLRGSQTAEDWLRDAEAVPQHHHQLGMCHAGFLAGMDDVFAEVRGVVEPQVAITGHSLGGARARILAGLFVCNRLKVDQLCVFGSPKPAFAGLATIIQRSGMAHTSYRNRQDVVPTVPLGAFPWVHTEPWIAVDAVPGITSLAWLRDHCSSLYVNALTALAAQGAQ